MGRKGELVYGVGVNDYDGKTTYKGKGIKSYVVWAGMLCRCYNKKYKGYKTYGAKGIYVCDEWLSFSKFKEWFDVNYIEGYHLDKDISGVVDSNGVKYYSPNSCRFVSPSENRAEMFERCFDKNTPRPKKKEVDIELIYKDLIGETEYSVRELARKYGVSRTKVENVRDNSKYLIDLDTGEEVLTLKNISVEQQMYYVIYNFAEEYENTREKEDKEIEFILIQNKSLIKRVSMYLNIKPNTASKWLKQRRLVSLEIMELELQIKTNFLNSRFSLIELIKNKK